MSYETMKNAYSALTEEQQLIVYNLTISLLNMNRSKAEPVMSAKREFGQFAGKATAVFADNWDMTEEELCCL
ncbi:MAG: hypothetical protein II707_02340 [Spirochaetales bacterium]|nr:hypothetical protein [Spirochaetales bacterium]MBR3732494.1 hypothetical protein [Spirochaetales bacterium]MBR6198741.1 hypothetical protein [Spirochaetales bacterium]